MSDELICYALYPYATRTQSEIASRATKRCRSLTFSYKNRKAISAWYGGEARTFEQIDEHFAAEVRSIADSRLSECEFVPVPRSKPDADLWPALETARRLNGHDGPHLSRRSAVAQSSSPDRRRRPSIDEHRLSMHLEGYLNARSVCLVDDTVTYGGTLLGARAALRAAGFAGDVFAVAFAYTLEAAAVEPPSRLCFALSTESSQPVRRAIGKWPRRE